MFLSLTQVEVKHLFSPSCRRRWRSSLVSHADVAHPDVGLLCRALGHGGGGAVEGGARLHFG